jgi:predicted 2-oxoglutarate/Fe(II)-dependent dioxygenase YbiX
MTFVPGQPAPWFHAAALGANPRFAFHTAAGYWMVMLFMGSGANEGSQAALDLVRANRDLFDDQRACFFGITIDPGDAQQNRIAHEMPGIRWFLDYDRAVSTLYGAARVSGDTISYTPHWLLLDPMLRVHRGAALADGAGIFAELRRIVAAPPVDVPAPVLVVPDVLSRETCRQLIGLYDRHGGTDSGFMREENGVTVYKVDHSHKRRADYVIDDEKLIGALKGRISAALKPVIQRAFQFDAQRIERWIVSCYDSRDGGFFRAHRDNTTKGTAHRRFACTINLNAEDYEGGDLRFPEFGQRTYRAPTGGAVVFSCSLLHEAQAVTAGRRYAFLPFLYDDEGARIRERNLAFVEPDLQSYRSGLPREAVPAAKD